MEAENQKNLQEYVGRQIRYIRKIKGMNQIIFAEALGVSYQQVQKYETGIN